MIIAKFMSFNTMLHCILLIYHPYLGTDLYVLRKYFFSECFLYIEQVGEKIFLISDGKYRKKYVLQQWWNIVTFSVLKNLVEFQVGFFFSKVTKQ